MILRIADMINTRPVSLEIGGAGGRPPPLGDIGLGAIGPTKRLIRHGGNWRQHIYIVVVVFSHMLYVPGAGAAGTGYIYIYIYMWGSHMQYLLLFFTHILYVPGAGAAGTAPVVIHVYACCL